MPSEKIQQIPLTKKEKELCRQAADAILWAFSWHETKEGADYWRQVTKNLRRLAGEVDE